MDIGAVLGLVIAFGGILLGFLVEAKMDVTAFASLIQPTAASIVFGGTIGAVLLSFPMSELKKLIWGVKTAFGSKKGGASEIEIIEYIIKLADKARKEGLLSLESEVQESEDRLLKKGIGLIVDGVNPELVKGILLRDIEFSASKFEAVAKICEKAGGYSPTMGVLGTVMGMVNILGHMGGDTAELAHQISVAFIATMYGVMFANVVYLPIGDRLKAKAEEENFLNMLIVEGILSIQAGENPRIIAEKLNLAMIKQEKGIQDVISTEGEEKK